MSPEREIGKLFTPRQPNLRGRGPESEEEETERLRRESAIYVAE